MANKKGHRRFGAVRKLPSGRYQARYPGPDGLMRPAPYTFAGKRDAEQWLSVKEAEIIGGDWIDPDTGKVELGEYGRRCIAERKVSKRTRDEDLSIWKHHVEPFLGRLKVNEVSPDRVRTWRTTLLENGRSEDRTAKAYRLLRLVYNIAVQDNRVKRNPCRIKGADKHRTPERPHATLEEVWSLADLMPERFRFLVLLAAFSGLRWGELVALHRRDIDARALVVRVGRASVQHNDGDIAAGPTKSEAGVRTVALPGLLRDELVRHLAEFAEPGGDGLVFTGKRGGALRRGNFHRETHWTFVVVKAGLPRGFHFHDLRHTGNQLAAEVGASTRELMTRMGHSSSRAALIYQHATSQRDRQIADELDRRVRGHKCGGGDGPDSGKGGGMVPAD